MFITALVLCTFISGCVLVPNITESTTLSPDSHITSTPPPETEPENAPKINMQYLPTTVENPDNLPVLKWVCLTELMLGGGLRTWSEAAAIELNQMLAERNMPFRVQFILMTSNQYYGEWEWMEQDGIPELLAEADLIYGYLTSSEMQELLLPITEHVTGDAQPSLQNAVPHEYYWQRGMVGDDIYGIAATTLALPAANGWYANEKVFSDLQLTTDDFAGKAFWETDDAFALLYERNGQTPFLYLAGDGLGEWGYGQYGGVTGYMPAVMEYWINNRFHSIGSIFGIDYSSENPVVVNYLDTDYVKDCWSAVMRYKNAGYVSTRFDQALIRYDSVSADFVYSNPNQTYELCIPSEALYLGRTAGNGFVSGISKTTLFPEEAKSLLALLGEDEAFRMQLFYGKEERDYSLKDGYYTSISQEGSRYSLDFLSCLSSFAGLTAHPQGTDGLRAPGVNNGNLPIVEGKTLLETHGELLNRGTAYYPYQYAYSEEALQNGILCFDFSECEKEMAAIGEVCAYYFSFITNTVEVDGKPAMTEALYKQMLQDLKEAGSDRLLAELQGQLEQWQQANGY